MAQNPIQTTVAGLIKATGKFIAQTADALGTQLVTRGGVSSRLNITAAVAVKAAPGRVARVVIIAPGTTSGEFTLNDCAATGDATAANTIWTLPYNGTNNVAGAVFDLDLPCAVGIVVSAVPGAGSPIIAVTYT